MVRWRADLQASVLAQRWGHGLFLTAALLVTLLPPWQLSYGLLNLLLLAAVMYEWRRHHHVLQRRCGALVWKENDDWRWQQCHWRLCPATCCLNAAILLRLRGEAGQQQFWLMRDSMSEAEWRALRYQILTAGPPDSPV